MLNALRKHYKKVILYLLGIGLLCILLGAITNMRILFIVGYFAIAPSFLFALGFLFIIYIGLIMYFADEVLPQFWGKNAFVWTIAIIMLIIIISTAWDGRTYNFPGPCQPFLGVPTC